MNYLYHGSMYLHDTLRPGYYHTREDKFWDETESNRFLYASSVREDAIDQGFASALEQKFQIDGYRSSPGEIVVLVNRDRVISLDDIRSLSIYVYKIEHSSLDGWIKNENAHNNLKTEWKTPDVIQPKRIKARIHIPIGEILTPLVVSLTRKEIKISKVQLDQMGLESLDRVLPEKPLFSDWM